MYKILVIIILLILILILIIYNKTEESFFPNSKNELNRYDGLIVDNKLTVSKIIVDTINADNLKTDYLNQLPKYSTIIWGGSLNDIPEGWAICNGDNGTPDLRGRFVLGYNDGYIIDSEAPVSIDISGSINESTDTNDIIRATPDSDKVIKQEDSTISASAMTSTLKSSSTNIRTKLVTDVNKPIRGMNVSGGEEKHKLTSEEIPKHKHDFKYGGIPWGNSAPGFDEQSELSGPAFGRQVGTKTHETGDNVPHNNMPPYYVLVYIMKL